MLAMMAMMVRLHLLLKLSQSRVLFVVAMVRTINFQLMLLLTQLLILVELMKLEPLMLVELIQMLSQLVVEVAMIEKTKLMMIRLELVGMK